MRVSRKALLRALELVTPGLSKTDLLEQSSCFVFRNGFVQTYNDEIACTIESPLPMVQGAVQAEAFRKLLGKMTEEHLTVEAKEAQLVIKGKGKRAGIRCEQETKLPVESIEQAGDWKPLPPEFGEGIEAITPSAGKDDGRFVLTCVHITPKWVEACDSLQLGRCRMEIPIKRPCLVRADAIRSIMGLDMSEFSLTPAWIHFRNRTGLCYSCRRYLDKFPNLNNLLKNHGEKIDLPPALGDAIEKAKIFSDDSDSKNLSVRLKKGKLLIEGMGYSGWYQEMEYLNYDGPDLNFGIAPKMLSKILKTSTVCEIAKNLLLIRSGNFTYVGSLG